MTAVRNISTGARGAYIAGELVMAEPGEVIEADDFAEEWFAVEGDAPAKRGRPAKAAEPEGDAE